MGVRAERVERALVWGRGCLQRVMVLDTFGRGNLLDNGPPSEGARLSELTSYSWHHSSHAGEQRCAAAAAVHQPRSVHHAWAQRCALLPMRTAPHGSSSGSWSRLPWAASGQMLAALQALMESTGCRPHLQLLQELDLLGAPLLLAPPRGSELGMQDGRALGIAGGDGIVVCLRGNVRQHVRTHARHLYRGFLNVLGLRRPSLQQPYHSIPAMALFVAAPWYLLCEWYLLCADALHS